MLLKVAQVEQLLDSQYSTLIAAALCFFGVVGYQVYSFYKNHIDVPAVGIPPGILGPWKAALRHFGDSESVVREGYRKFSDSAQAFKISTPARYIVFVTSPAHITELKLAPDHLLSFDAPSSDRIATPWTLDDGLNDYPYHIPLIRKNLTSALAAILPDVADEVEMAFKEHFRVGEGWTKVNIFQTLLPIIGRTSNRLFVGLPLCRNKEYLDLVVAYAVGISQTAPILDMAPSILRPFIMKYMINKPKKIREILKHVGPIMDERREKLKLLGDKWTDRPKDAVQWILESAPPGRESTNEMMTIRLLFLNFASIHTTSMSAVHAIYDLAFHSEYQAPLRAEIEEVMREDGGVFTKQGLTKMKKLDSVLKESQRMSSVSGVTMARKAMKQYTFSNGGLTVPKGTWICAPASAVHHDDKLYDDPMKYDGFRFSNLREEEGQATKHQMVSTANEYLAFGHGIHACPGRFFAVNELKVLLSHIIRKYEFKTIDEKRPGNMYFVGACIPDLDKELLFRRRGAEVVG